MNLGWAEKTIFLFIYKTYKAYESGESMKRMVIAQERMERGVGTEMYVGDRINRIY
jgi:hypothetical protein